MMNENHPTSITRLADYTPSAYWIDHVDLTIDLDPAKTRVLNRMKIRRNPEAIPQALRLDGEDLNLSRVLVNGQASSFKMEGTKLVLDNLPEGDAPFDVEIFTTCVPAKNTKLMGLYVSQEAFFTQCEAEGFRRITFFLDRPDVMSLYTVTLRADKQRYPVLLSNGNLIEQGEMADGRHFAKWHDPHKKPCYLFALVAGNFVCREQRIHSQSGSEHLLQIYVRSQDLDKTEHAMRSLVASIAWDEARFGLKLDLERFMIVAVSDFNMGAMENKGLNIFNTKFVLANAATATDTDFANVESVIAHEYFHNWTGNRVTCRDWFQLSLKEGLTVFRDQEFSQDMSGSPSARAVKRIEDVRLLRSHQFAEDASPMAHPVRPASYVEISNFYTVTIYEKGAEVVRMMHTLVGESGFQKGMQLYFERHDGQAVTCDDFAQAIADANPHSPLALYLEEFKRWYSQAGTPRVKVRQEKKGENLLLHFTQSCPATPGQAEKEPFIIPIRMGLLDAQSGAEVSIKDGLMTLTQQEMTLTIPNIQSPVVPSLLRGFSAPVILEYDYSEADLLTLLVHDSDAFNRWEAAQQLFMRQIVSAIADKRDDVFNPAVIEAARGVLLHPELDAAFKELVLTLPSESYIADQLQSPEGFDPLLIHLVRECAKTQLASSLQQEWQHTWETLSQPQAYQIDPVSSGRRALAQLALQMLCHTGEHSAIEAALLRVKLADNMTDRYGALQALVAHGAEQAPIALADFYARFKHEALVLDKWFALQANYAPDASTVRKLMQHPDFTLHNPNRARSVVFTFCNLNARAFHKQDASGYVFWSECMLELDAINPQVAARLARSMDKWQRLSAPYRAGAKVAIERVLAKATLSKDSREVLERSLQTSPSPFAP